MRSGLGQIEFLLVELIEQFVELIRCVRWTGVQTFQGPNRFLDIVAEFVHGSTTPMRLSVVRGIDPSAFRQGINSAFAPSDELLSRYFR